MRKMKIKQLTYTATDNGWAIERCKGSVNEREKKEFKSISSRRPFDGELYSYDFNDGVGVLLRSIPYGTDVVGRERFYAHGYVFSEKDCDEAFDKYSCLLGIDYFASGEKDELLDEDKLGSKFTHVLELKDNCALLEGIYEALLKNKCMEVRFEGANGEKLIKTVMNTVLKYVPLQLRKFISFGSGMGKRIRTVTATDSFSNFAKIRLDLKSGKAEGLDGSYDELVKTILEYTNDSIAFLEKRIGVVGIDRAEAIATAEAAIRDLMFEVLAGKPLEKEEISVKLNEVFERKSYSASADIKILCNIFEGAKKHKILFPNEADEKILGVFMNCPEDAVREHIVNYLAKKAVNTNDFAMLDSLLSCKEADEHFKAVFTEKILSAKNEEVAEYITKRALDDADYAKVIALKCSEECLKIVSKSAAKIILKEADKKSIFENLVKTDLFTLVMEALIKKGEDASLWEYILVMYSSKENMKKHASCDKKVVEFFDELFCREALMHKDDVMAILERVYYEIDEKLYESIENKLVNSGNGVLIEEFYVKFLAGDAKSSLRLEELKENLKRMNLSIKEYIVATVGDYAKLCFKEIEQGKGDDLKLIEKISLFVEGMDVEEIPDIKNIKEDFWRRFQFEAYKLTEDVRIMALSGNKKSLLANEILNLAEYVKGERSDVRVEDFEWCKKNLCTPSKWINKKGQDAILRHLKSLVKKPKELDVETVLLVNYSNRKKTVDVEEAGISGEDLCAYIEKSLEDKKSLLYVRGVYKALYNYVDEMSKKAEKGKKKAEKGNARWAEAAALMKERHNRKFDIVKQLFQSELVRYLLLMMVAVLGNLAMVVIKRKYIAAWCGIIAIWMQFAIVSSIIQKSSKRRIIGFLIGSIFLVFTAFVLAFKA